MWSDNLDLIQHCFAKTNGEHMHDYIVIGRYTFKSYFIKNHSKSNYKYKQGEIIQMF